MIEYKKKHTFEEFESKVRDSKFESCESVSLRVLHLSSKNVASNIVRHACSKEG